MLKMKPIAKQIYDSLSYLDFVKDFVSINAMGKKKERKKMDALTLLKWNFKK